MTEMAAPGRNPTTQVAPSCGPQTMAVVPQPPRKKRDWKWHIIIPVGVVVLFLAGIGIGKLVSGGSKPKAVAMDDEYYEEIDSPADDAPAKEVEEMVAADPIADSVAAYEESYDEEYAASGNLPASLPSNFTGAFNVGGLYATDLSAFESSNDHDLRQLSSADGYINDLPVTFRLHVSDDGTVTGKYAYRSTLNKYGDHPSSWFKVKGSLLDSTEGDGYIGFVSYNPDGGKMFEYWLLRVTHDGAFLGNMMNVRYLDSPTPHLYNVSIQ